MEQNTPRFENKTTQSRIDWGWIIQFKVATDVVVGNCGLELAKALQNTTTYNDGKMGDRAARTILRRR